MDQSVAHDIAAVIALLVSIGFIIALIFFILSLYKTLKMIQLKNRSCSPGWCWCLIIPFVNVVFTWVIVFAMLPNSIQRELSTNELALRHVKHLKALGLAYAILGTVAFVFGLLDLLPGLMLIMMVGMLVLWIIYWIKVVKIRRTYLLPNVI